MQSKSKTVIEYLAELPEERRIAVEAIRKVILKNLDKDYEEGMQYGMIGYYVPHRIFPAGYHCDPRQPVCFAGLASQKNYISIYLMSVYGDPGELDWFRQAWEKSGKKLEMGKSCIRLKSLADIDLNVIGQAIRRVPAHKYIANYVKALQDSASQKLQRKSATGKKSTPATKRPVKAKNAAKAARVDSKPVRKKAVKKATRKTR